MDDRWELAEFADEEAVGFDRGIESGAANAKGCKGARTVLEDGPA